MGVFNLFETTYVEIFVSNLRFDYFQTQDFFLLKKLQVHHGTDVYYIFLFYMCFLFSCYIFNIRLSQLISDHQNYKLVYRTSYCIKLVAYTSLLAEINSWYSIFSLCVWIYTHTLLHIFVVSSVWWNVRDYGQIGRR